MVHAQVTVVLFASRDMILEKIKARLDEIEQHNLLVMVDGDLNLFLKCRNLFNRDGALIVRSKQAKPPQKTQNYRRKRIAELHNESKGYIGETDLILGIEDDGLFPKDGLTKLLKHYNNLKNVGMITGVELGRWTTPYIGAWLVDDPLDVKEIQSIQLTEQEIMEIDTAGFFFYLTSKENYLKHNYYPTRNWGPDIEWGLNLRRNGLQNYLDTTIHLDHYIAKDRFINPSNKPYRITHMKNKNGIWRSVFKPQSVV